MMLYDDLQVHVCRNSQDLMVILTETRTKFDKKLVFFQQKLGKHSFNFHCILSRINKYSKM